jgi:hypothetical protein
VSGVVLATDGQGRPEPEAVFAFQDQSITESSGLVDLGQRVLTVNDSGDGALVYLVDKTTGETVGRTTYTDNEVVDVEAMAPGVDGTVWVGDIGDNAGSRTFVVVYELPVPQPGETTVAAKRYELVYDGGPRDAEALLVHPETGRVHVASKGVFGGTLFAAPAELRTDRTNVLRPVADVPGLITDGSFFPDGRFAALRSYGNLTVLSSDRWRNVEGMTLPDQPQGEGLAMTDSGRDVLLSTEGAGSEVLNLPLSKGIVDRVAPAEPSPSPAPAVDYSESASPEEAEDGGVWRIAALGGFILVGGLVARRWAQRRGE